MIKNTSKYYRIIHILQNTSEDSKYFIINKKQELFHNRRRYS